MISESNTTDEQIDGVRSFNRLYTRQIGLLGEGLLNSAFSLTEVRVLYELAHQDNLTASQLGRDLSLDPGYLSRILKKFEQLKLVTRTPSKVDARQAMLSLTAEGQTTFQPLEQASRDQVAKLLETLAPSRRDELIASMRSICHLLVPESAPPVPYMLRPHAPGDIGWVIHRQGVLYNREYGWDETFEALVAEICAEFVQAFKPGREYCWIAERHRQVVGSVFVCQKSDAIAQLRLLYVEPEARGLGIGARLVEECVRFARNKNYRMLTLWTNDVLGSARRIYEANGFKLVAEERHQSFGKSLVGQNWDLEL